MIAVIQRVKRASVEIDGRISGQCGRGLMILLGVAEGDSELDAQLLAAKIAKLRIFCDEDGKMNLSVKDVEGEMVVVSNFTLLANYVKGNRPDYFGAAAPDEAEGLYNYFGELVEKEVSHVGSGEFGADMEVTIVNDGPVTIVMDSKMLRQKKNS